MPQSCKFKILVIGESSVGKSALLCRYADDIFSNNYTATVSVDFKVKKILVDGEEMELQIWDTAGQERFRNVTKAYYRGAMGIFIVYDITDRKSYERIDTWMQHIANHASNDVHKVILGNKVDMSESARVVSTEEGQAVADKYGVPFLEASAKENTNVSESFEKMARTIKEAVKIAPKPKAATIQLDNQLTHKNSNKKQGCCS